MVVDHVSPVLLAREVRRASIFIHDGQRRSILVKQEAMLDVKVIKTAASSETQISLRSAGSLILWSPNWCGDVAPENPRSASSTAVLQGNVASTMSRRSGCAGVNRVVYVGFIRHRFVDFLIR